MAGDLVLRMDSRACVDIGRLARELQRKILEDRPLRVVLDVTPLRANLVAIEALSRLLVMARWLDRELVLVGGSQELDGLIELCGLREALPRPLLVEEPLRPVG